MISIDPQELKILNSLSIGVQIIDANMRYIYLNDFLLQSLSKTLEEHLHQRMEDMYPGIEKSKIYKGILNCLKSGESLKVNNEFTFEDGRRTFWELELHNIENRVIIFSRDVTDTKKGEILLIESNEKLEAKVLERTLKLEQVNKRIRTILAHVSHDLRTALGNIVSLCDILTLQPKSRGDILKNIYTIANDNLEIVRTLLDAAALEDGKIRLQKTNTNLAKLIEQSVSRTSQAYHLSPTRFVVKVSTSIQANIDPYRFQQVFDNLFSNSIKYSPDNTEVHVGLNDDGLFSISNVVDQHKVEKATRETTIKHTSGFGVDIINAVLSMHSMKANILNNNDLYKVTIHLSQ